MSVCLSSLPARYDANKWLAPYDPLPNVPDEAVVTDALVPPGDARGIGEGIADEEEADREPSRGSAGTK